MSSIEVIDVPDSPQAGTGWDEATPTVVLAGRFAHGEAERLAAAAEQLRLLGELERRKVHVNAGHSSIYGYLRAVYGWSECECRHSIAIARAGQAHPELLDTIADGRLPLGHAYELARVLNRGRVADTATFPVDFGYWLNEGGREHDHFAQGVREWENTAAAADATTDTELARQCRYARIRQRDGMLHLRAGFDPVSGAEFVEAWAHACDALFRTDADQPLPDGNLSRTDAQRGADALLLLARLAGQAGNNPKADAAVDPGVLIVVDEHSFTEQLLAHTLDRPRSTMDTETETESELQTDEFAGPLPQHRHCRTVTGLPIDPATAVEAALVGWVRFAVVDSLNRPVKVSSKQRLFRGPIRQTLLAMWPRCIHPGCRRRSGSCHIDHAHPHSRGGPTTLANATPGPLCPRHNNFKQLTDYIPALDGRGHWYLRDRSGNPVV